jgi:hypothetical protein
MTTVKLGSKEFRVDSEEIRAEKCGVSDADCTAFAARMKTGEISRVKKLDLVRFILFCWLLNLLFFLRRHA